MKKYKYTIVNLDCANCARKIEESLNENPKLNNAIVNFNTSKISFESNDDISLEYINNLVQRIENDSYVTLNKVNPEQKKEYNIYILVIAIILGIIGLNTRFLYSNFLVILSYILLLYKIFINAIKYLIKNKNINENTLITISCIGAFLVGEKFEGIMVVVLYTIGKILEEKAINSTKESISDLLDIKQDYANLKIGDKIKTVNSNSLKIDDIIVIKKGERIPVDGIVIKGSANLDTSMLTGESELVSVSKNDIVLSGVINTSNIIEVKVTSLYKDSTVSKILELVEDATDKKAKTETSVSKLSKIYTPTVLILAILVAILLPLITTVTYSESIYRSLTFLVISCPCAIAISVPLSYFCGIGVSSKNGILIKGSNYLDNLSKVTKIVFDKTGTLTTGNFKVMDIKIKDKRYKEDEIIEIIRSGESLSNHPIAKSIMKLSKKSANSKLIKNYKEIEGIGIEYDYKDKHVKIGTKNVCNNCKLKTNIHINIDGIHVASLDIDDGIKENALNTISSLKKQKIKTYMFTGDKKEVALEIGKNLGIDEIKYEMLPTDKYTEYEKLTSKNDIVVFIGDGINDAPVLKRADIGISMGGIGSSAAISSSDIVLMTDDLSKITKSIEISKYTNYIIRQNLIFAIGIKVLILILSIFGFASMYLAVFADTGVTLLTILNTLRIMKKNK